MCSLALSNHCFFQDACPHKFWSPFGQIFRWWPVRLMYLNTAPISSVHVKSLLTPALSLFKIWREKLKPQLFNSDLLPFLSPLQEPGKQLGLSDCPDAKKCRPGGERHPPVWRAASGGENTLTHGTHKPMHLVCFYWTSLSLSSAFNRMLKMKRKTFRSSIKLRFQTSWVRLKACWRTFSWMLTKPRSSNTLRPQR